MFQKCLAVMGSLYASLTSTSVLRLTRMPAQPKEFAGVVTLYAPAPLRKLLEALEANNGHPTEHPLQRPADALGAVTDTATGAVTGAVTDALGGVGDVSPSEEHRRRARAADVLQDRAGVRINEDWEARIIRAILDEAALEDARPKAERLGQPASALAVDLFGSVLSWKVHGSSALLRFETHSLAEYVIALLRDIKVLQWSPVAVLQSVTADFYYNARPVESRGWPTFEVGAATVVVAHLDRAERRGQLRGTPYAEAQKTWKLMDINDSKAARRISTRLRPEQVLKATRDAIASERKTHFVGKADRASVRKLLKGFESDISKSIDDARAQGWERAYQVDPKSDDYRMARARVRAERAEDKTLRKEAVAAQLSNDADYRFTQMRTAAANKDVERCLRAVKDRPRLADRTADTLPAEGSERPINGTDGGSDGAPPVSDEVPPASDEVPPASDETPGEGDGGPVQYI